MSKESKKKIKENHELMKAFTSSNGNYKSRKAAQHVKYEAEKLREPIKAKRSKFKIEAGIPA